MLVKDVMTRTSLKLFETDELQEVLQLFNQQNIEFSLVYNYREELIGTCSKLAILEGINEGKKVLEQIVTKRIVLLSENEKITDVQIGEEPCHPVQNDLGMITGFLTKEQYFKAYANALQLELKHYDAIFNSAHNGIISIDAFGQITSINPAAEKMAKTTKAEAVGKFLTDVVLPAGLLQVVRTGEAQTEKYRAGKRTYVTNRSPIIEKGKIVGAVGVFQDISEIEFISNELQTVKQLVNELNAIINTSMNGVCIVKNNKITKMNKPFSKMFGLKDEAKNETELPTEIENLVNHVKETKTEQSLLNHNPNTNHSLIMTGTPLIHEGEIEAIVINVKDMTEMEKLRDELRETKEQLNTMNQNHFVYRSRLMHQLMNTVKQIAAVDVTVLISGESGVGKGEIARIIHEQSARKNEPFVRVNCGAIPDTLIESELFGYEPGAFTGASRKGKKGYFERAENGTIFLDEIGELPLHVQVKLLTALQEKEITRIGSEKSKKINIRIIAATNRDLQSLVAEGKFREDLYYRLNVMPIHIPALREREDDIPLLVDQYVQYFNEKYRKNLLFTEDAKRVFLEYQWPGNVRELVNVMERIYVTTTNSIVDQEDVYHGLNITDNTRTPQKKINVESIVPLKDAIAEVEKQLIQKALQTGKSYRQIAKLLDVNVSTISRKIKKYGKDFS